MFIIIIIIIYFIMVSRCFSTEEAPVEAAYYFEQNAFPDA